MNMHPENKKAIQAIEKLLSEVKAQSDVMIKKYPANDIRISFYGLTGNVLHSLLLVLIATIQTVANKEWWQQHYGRTMTQQDLEAIRNIEKLSKHSFFVFFLSRIETLMRKTINLVSPGFDPTGIKPFKLIYDRYFEILDLNSYVNLYDICRLVRNSIHSNGVYINKKGQNIKLHWDGKEYNFIHRKPIDFMSADNIYYLFQKLIESLNAIVSTDFYLTHDFIEDKYHE